MMMMTKGGEVEIWKKLCHKTQNFYSDSFVINQINLCMNENK